MKRTNLVILPLIIGAVVIFYTRPFERATVSDIDTPWVRTRLLSFTRTSQPLVQPVQTHQDEATDQQFSIESTKPRSTGYQPLPSSVIDRVKAFVLFVGHARSGHSIVGSILDSHPHIVIAHESNILKKTYYATSKSYLYNQLWKSSYMQASGGLRTANSTKKGYSLAIHGACQGSYQSYIDVIGDKKGDMTSTIFGYNSKRFQNTVNKLRSIINVPIKLFHVIRNPYDNIATAVLYQSFKFLHISAIKQSNESVTVNPNVIDSQIEAYFYHYRAAEGVKLVMPDHETMEVHGKDLVSDPKAVISDMCKYLEVHCSDDYMNVASKQVFGGESKTRYKIKWEDYQILKVQEHISEFDSLKRYIDFDY